MEVAFNEADYLQRDDIFSRQAVDRFFEVGEIRSWCSPFLAKEYFMNALVLFDGEYGNTERIARAITDALPPTISVRLERAS